MSHQPFREFLTSRESRRSAANPTFTRRLGVEALEDRRLLAVLTVQNALDDTLVNLAGDGELSLREAIEVANNPGTTIDGFSSNDVDDTIHFDAALSGQTINLSGMELVLSESITIDASSLNEKITIDANQQSRVIDIDTESGDYALHNLIITGGQTVDDSSFSDRTRGAGGGIRSFTKGTLAIYNTEVVHNRTLGSSASGGGIYSGEGKLALHNSTVSHNTAANGVGGGVAAGVLVITPDEVMGPAGELALVRSTISNNHAMRSGGTGGGILSFADTTLLDSTVSGNLAEGMFGGGGIYHNANTLAIVQSTVSDNHATSTFDSARGGGVFTAADDLTIASSIIAGNSSVVLRNDLSIADPAFATIHINHSLIGDTTGTSIDTNTGVGNILDVDPLLGPLSDNGGPTQTHALLPGSPTLDAGDASIQPSPNLFDQRGAPFSRVSAGTLLGIPQQVIDIGAYEAQFPPSADFVENGRIDGGDFLAWQRGFGETDVATRADGNSDGDTDVDQSDLAAWQTTYGQSVAPPPPGAAMANAELTDAALSVTFLANDMKEKSISVGNFSGNSEVVDSVFSNVASHIPQPLLVADILELPPRHGADSKEGLSLGWLTDSVLQSIFA